jgi:hypothetical protein
MRQLRPKQSVHNDPNSTQNAGALHDFSRPAVLDWPRFDYRRPKVSDARFMEMAVPSAEETLRRAWQAGNDFSGPSCKKKQIDGRAGRFGVSTIDEGRTIKDLVESG